MPVALVVFFLFCSETIVLKSKPEKKDPEITKTINEVSVRYAERPVDVFL